MSLEAHTTLRSESVTQSTTIGSRTYRDEPVWVVELSDGRTVHLPIDRDPRALKLDEDVSIEGVMRGWRPVWTPIEGG